MNKDRLGSSFFDSVRKWERANPSFRAEVEASKEKQEMAFLLKKIRTKAGLSQAALAKKAGVPQSVIGRIESPTSTVMPRMDLFTRLITALGYRICLQAYKLPPHPKMAA